METRAGLWVVVAALLAGEVLGWRWAAARVILLAGAAALLAAAPALGRRPALWAAVALAVAALGAARVQGVVRPTFPPGHVARLPLPVRTLLAGRIVAAPDRRDGRVTLIVAAEHVGDGAGRRPAIGRVRLTLRHPDRRWRYGERIAAEVRLRAPRNFENPGSFDWVGHLARQHIHVTAALWDGAAARQLPGRLRGARAGLEGWRERVGDRIDAAVEAPAGPVLRALVIGDAGAIEPDLRAAFTRAGVVHVLSVSGLHVGLVAAGGVLALRWLLARSSWLLLRLDVDRTAAVLGLAPVALYTALAGFGIPTLRAALMCTAAVLAGLAGRRISVTRALAVAAALLALVWPGSPLDVGFQLSFASVAAIVWGATRARGAPDAPRWRRRLRVAAAVPAAALLGTAPLTAFHFHQLSLAGLIANPLAVPLFGSVVVCLGLGGALLEPIVPLGATLLFVAAGHALRPGLALVEALGRMPWAAVDVPIPTLVELGLVYALLLGLALGGVGQRVAAVALIGLVVDGGGWLHERWLRQTLRVTFLDVGQGDAAVAELPGGAVLVIDAGGFPGSDFDTGAAVVGPFLWTRKIRRVDALVMSHAHPDHAGGLAHLLEHHHPREFWWTGVAGAGPAWERLTAALAASGARVRVLDAAAAPPLPAVGLAVLHPPAGHGGLSLNDSSLTLRLGSGSGRVLMTGDIEHAAEIGLLASPARLRAEVLKVPHHGSRTSSTPAFVAAVAPRVAVVSVGADNRYALPAAEVEARYRAAGVCLLRTDRCGAITLETDGRRLAVETMRPGCVCPTPPG